MAVAKASKSEDWQYDDYVLHDTDPIYKCKVKGDDFYFEQDIIITFGRFKKE